MSWEVSNAQWLSWIEHDASTPRARWVSCDDFDEYLRQKLQIQPFVTATEHTIVGRTEDTASTLPPIGASGEVFDSMATVVRMAPTGPEIADLEAAQTLTHGSLDEPSARSGRIEVSVEGGAYEVELEASPDGRLSRSGDTLIPTESPRSEGKPGGAESVPGLFIPTLTRSATDYAPDEPGVAEPVGPSSSGTMVVLPPDPSELQVQPATSGNTVIVQTPTEPSRVPYSSDFTVVAPEPVALRSQSGLTQPHPLVPPMEPEESQTAGVIEPPATLEELDEVEIRPSADKVVVESQGTAEGAENSLSIPIDASDIVEDDDLVEEIPEAEEAIEVVTPPVPPSEPEPLEDEDSIPEFAIEAVLEDDEPPPKVSSRKTGGWYDEVFAEHFAALRRRGLGKTAKAEVEFFLQSTGLQPGARVLDVGCGDGAHAITLAQRGYQVTAMDLYSAQLDRAAAAASRLGVNIDFQYADMRDMDLGRAFDGILCLGTTFGYFEDDVNRGVLRRMRDHLSPSGRMLLSLVNRDYIASRLPSRSWWQGHGCLVLDESEMNYFTNRLRVHRTIVFEDGRQFEHDMHIRVYGAYELGRMCVDTGLKVVEISGSRHTRGRFYGATSPEIWLVMSRG